MAKPNTELWLVRVCYYEPTNPEADMLSLDTFKCNSEAEAVAGLERVIREDWTAEAEIDGVAKSLADCRGKTENDWGQHGSWGYTEDGKRAWMFHSDGHGYKGEVVRL